MSQVWQEAKAADGKIYYYNVQTKATQWTKPVELMSSAEVKPFRSLADSRSPADDMAESIAGSRLERAQGRRRKTLLVYYPPPPSPVPYASASRRADRKQTYRYHAQTRETTWSMPDEYRQALEKVQHTPPHGLPAMPAFVAGGTQQSGQQQQQQQSQNTERALAIPGQMMEAAADGTARPMTLPTSITASDKNEPQYSNFDEAESAFVKLLRRSNVGTDWTWERTLRAIIKEPQYRALKDPKDRKAAFDKYIIELKQQEQEKAKDRIAKLRQDFSVMLKSHPEIKHYTRWKYVYARAPDTRRHNANLRFSGLRAS